MNTSGINPVEYNVLIQLDKVEEQTPGGLYIPEDTKDKEGFAQVKGTLVAASPMAFDFADWPDDVPGPSVGNRVLIARHAGTEAEGMDGNTYRIVKDKDVLAVTHD